MKFASDGKLLAKPLAFFQKNEYDMKEIQRWKSAALGGAPIFLGKEPVRGNRCESGYFDAHSE